jgi:hypothetical protein
MRRLSVARDRELRHIQDQQVAWRWADTKGGWYPWCRVCSRDARKQVDWLADSGYTPKLPQMFSAVRAAFRPANVQPTDLVGAYLERYPR